MKRFALATVLILSAGALGVAYYFGLLTDFDSTSAKSTEAIQPVSFTSKDGNIEGWKVAIPGNRALATPAVASGKIFVGGGFGSREFYALDAVTGQKIWEYQTKDDGPTAAVVEDGYVGFNTESCELEILTIAGKPVWKKWLGDPLMSMPAIAKGRVYMAYPDSKGDQQHYLVCFDVRDGKEHWKRPIAGDIITAPVIADDRVYLATLEGTLSCFEQLNGELVWSEKKNATSSPVVWKGHCYFSQREEVTFGRAGKQFTQQTEQLAGRSAILASGGSVVYGPTRQNADYLDYSKRKTAGAKSMAKAEADDAKVGFSQAPASAKLGQSKDNLGQANVSAIWAYQGSKPFVYKERLYSAMGDTLQCVDPKTEKIIWQRAIRPNSAEKEAKPLLNHILTPPALVNDKVFLGTTFGEVLCLSAESGEVLWKVNLGESIVFQPAIASGRVYVPTNSGNLYCLRTGDGNDDGWYMWGANAAHNGIVNPVSP